VLGKGSTFQMELMKLYSTPRLEKAIALVFFRAAVGASGVPWFLMTTKG
jgi:hypothetical protein